MFKPSGNLFPNICKLLLVLGVKLLKVVADLLKYFQQFIIVLNYHLDLHHDLLHNFCRDLTEVTTSPGCIAILALHRPGEEQGLEELGMEGYNRPPWVWVGWRYSTNT